MTERPVLQPTAEHPITVAPTGRHVTVRVNGEVVAETDNALTLREASYPPVQYIPLADVDASRTGSELTRSDTTTYCPYKGEAGYYNVGALDDVIWTYEHPYPSVAAIAGHVAFYPDKAEITVS